MKRRFQFKSVKSRLVFLFSMVESKTLGTFSYYILKKFMEITDSNFGVFFTLDREKKIFELMESFKTDIPEGEIAATIIFPSLLTLKPYWRSFKNGWTK